MRIRTGTVLTRLISEYIQTAQPVASEALTRKVSLKVSSATMRNEMAVLEEEGYILRPHISSGAVPSDKGYRFYVQRLGDGVGPQPAVARQVRYRFERAGKALDRWMQITAKMLAEIVGSVAMVTFPSATLSRVKRIEIVQLQEFLSLLIVVLQGTRLLQQMVTLSKPATQGELNAVGNKLSSLFGGLDRRQMGERQADLSLLEGRVKEDALAMMQEADEEAFDPHVDGLRHLLRQPELSEGDKVGALVDVLEERGVLRKVLAEVAEQGRVRVIIGTENSVEILWPFSLVLCPYGVQGEVSGILGVLGPTRLAYADAIGNVRFLSDVMTDMVCSVHDIER